MVLETAVNGRADLLVTFNQKDFAAVAEGLRSKYCGRQSSASITGACERVTQGERL